MRKRDKAIYRAFRMRLAWFGIRLAQAVIPRLSFRCVVRLGQHLYGHSDNKGWTCQDFKTGEVLWQDKEKLGKGSLTYADGLLVLREERKGKGAVALIEASPEGYQEKGRFTPPDQSGKENWPHPVIFGGRLYLRDQDVLLCYQVK